MKNSFKNILYLTVFTGIFTSGGYSYAHHINKAEEVAPEPIAISALSEELNKNVQMSADLLSDWEEKGFHLYEVLAHAYQNNPTLLARRAAYQSIQEQLPQAQSGFKPNINAQGSINYTNTETEGENFGNEDGGNTEKTVGVSLDQPLFRGGSTFANIKAANAVIAAQKASVYASEQEIMRRAVTAYMDVMRSHAFLELNKNNRALIARELEQAEARFDVGELTKTDVSQSQARLALADAGLTQAEGNLNTAKAVYLDVTGLEANEDNFSLPELTFQIPDTKEEALRLSELQNLNVIAAENNEIAAQYDVDSRFGALLPQLDLSSSVGRNFDSTAFTDEQDRFALGVTATIPLYQSGATRSRVREAKHIANQRFMEVMEVKNAARSAAATQYSIWQTAQAEIASRKAQVAASTLAREGVQFEAEFGERTTLDALDANQELLNAQLDLITAMRDEVVARFELAETLGLLTPQNLDLFELNEDR